MFGLVLGDANCVYEDAAAALKLFKPDAIAATNNIGKDWEGRVDYWCTLHPMPCTDWVGIVEAMRRRLEAGRNRPQTWAHKIAAGVDKALPDWAGSSGLLAVKVLLWEGCTHIVGAGVPLHREGAHYYTSRPWETASSFRQGWEKHANLVAPRFRSMSGWTQHRFGAPTKAWFKERDHPAVGPTVR